MITDNPIIQNIYIEQRDQRIGDPQKGLIVQTAMQSLPSNDNGPEDQIFKRLIADLKSLQLVAVQGYSGIDFIEINGPTWSARFKELLA